MAFQSDYKSLTIGGRTFTPSEIENMVILYGYVGTASRYATLRTSNTSSGYQVPSGKTLYIDVICDCSTSTNVYGVSQPGYGDTDVSFDNAAAPTNLVSLSGFTTSANFGMGPFFTNNTSVTLRDKQDMAMYSDYPLVYNPAVGYQYLDFTVPQNKYPVVRINQANSTIIVYGHLV